MDDFIHAQGIIWLPHIMRRLANQIVEASDELLAEYGVTVPSNAVSVVHLLYTHGPQTVMKIAALTSQSHPLINKYVKLLKGLGLADTRSDSKDRRRTIVALSPAGEEQARKLLDVRRHFVPAYLKLMRDADADVFEPLWRIEAALRSTRFADRVRAEWRGEMRDA
jgi:DNA-binding MarR family transcriptional regulator